MRVPTEIGDVWFRPKWTSWGTRRPLRSSCRSGSQSSWPPLLARDPQTVWMLICDAGAKLRDVVPRDRSLDR